MCGSGVDVASSLLLISAILMAVGEQPFHLSRCPNFRNRLTLREAEFIMIPFGQLLLVVSIPSLVSLIGAILNQVGYYHLSGKIDRQAENLNSQITTLPTTIHA